MLLPDARRVGAGSRDALGALRVLLVGAGGIGCEVAHGLVELGIGCLHIIDLDRIDASNLNRQFLFRRADIGRLKSEVIVEHLARSLTSPQTELVAHAGDIRDLKQFSWSFFRSFHIVLNALDNLEARQHVNKMCVATGVPLIDTGSAGYLGQMMPILPGISECYQCTPKPTPRQFAVCTIRSNPEKPAHCVAWAKHLYSHLFTSSTHESLLTDLACCWDGNEALETYSSRLLQFLFRDEIMKQATMLEQAGDRRGPRPIDEALLLETQATPVSVLERVLQRQTAVWEVTTCIEILKAVVPRLCRRSSPRPFDKDDVDALAFVTAMSNLRSFCYRVEPLQSPFEVKGIAGDIVHAIAATNAIVAGLAITELCKWHSLLNCEHEIIDPLLARSTLRCIFVLRKPTPSRYGSSLLLPETLAPPNANCETCARGKVAAVLNCSLDDVTLGDFIREFLQAQLGIPVEARLCISFLSYDGAFRPRISLLYEDTDWATSDDDKDDDAEDEQLLWQANRGRTLTALGVHVPAEFRIEALKQSEEDASKTDLRLCFDVFLQHNESDEPVMDNQCWRVLGESRRGNWESALSPAVPEDADKVKENTAESQAEEVAIIDLDADWTETGQASSPANDRSGPNKRFRSATNGASPEDIHVLDT